MGHLRRFSVCAALSSNEYPFASRYLGFLLEEPNIRVGQEQKMYMKPLFSTSSSIHPYNYSPTTPSSLNPFALNNAIQSETFLFKLLSFCIFLSSVEILNLQL